MNIQIRVNDSQTSPCKKFFFTLHVYITNLTINLLTLYLKVRVFMVVSHVTVTESPSPSVKAKGPYCPSWYTRPVLASRTQTFFGCSPKRSNGLCVTPTKKMGLSPLAVTWNTNRTVVTYTNLTFYSFSSQTFNQFSPSFFLSLSLSCMSTTVQRQMNRNSQQANTNSILSMSRCSSSQRQTLRWQRSLENFPAEVVVLLLTEPHISPAHHLHT